MADPGIIKQFLVGLGFEIDANSLKRFSDAITNQTKGVQNLSVTLVKATEESVRKSEQHLYRFTDNLTRLGKGLVGFGAEITAAGTAVIASVTHTATGLDQLYFQSRRIGESAGRLMTWRSAMSSIGVSAGEAQGAIESFAQTLQIRPWIARGLGQQMGVPFTPDKPIQMFENFARALRSQPLFIQQSWAEMLGIPFQTMRQLGQPGALGTLRQAEQERVEILRQWGINARNSAEAGYLYSQAVSKLDFNLQALQIVVADKLLPTFRGWANWLLNIGIPSFTDFDKSFNHWPATLGEIAAGVLGVNTVFRLLVGVNPLAGLVRGAGGLFGAGGLLTMTGIGAAVFAAWELYKNWDQVSAYLQAKWKDINAAFHSSIEEGLITTLLVTGEAAGKAFMEGFVRKLGRGLAENTLFGQWLSRNTRGLNEKPGPLSSQPLQDKGAEAPIPQVYPRMGWQNFLGLKTDLMENWLQGSSTIAPQVRQEDSFWSRLTQTLKDALGIGPGGTGAAPNAAGGGTGVTRPGYTRGRGFGTTGGVFEGGEEGGEGRSAYLGRGRLVPQIITTARSMGASDEAIQGLLTAAIGEGGLEETWKPGDKGTSFGPWQLHRGGRLDKYLTEGGKPGDVEAMTKYVLRTMGPGFTGIKDAGEAVRLMHDKFLDYGSKIGNLPAGRDIFNRYQGGGGGTSGAPSAVIAGARDGVQAATSGAHDGIQAAIGDSLAVGIAGAVGLPADAIGGTTPRQIYTRVHAHLKDFANKRVVVTAGSNPNAGFDQTQMGSLRNMLGELHGVGAKAVVMGVSRGVKDWRRWNTEIEKAAKETGHIWSGGEFPDTDEKHVHPRDHYRGAVQQMNRALGADHVGRQGANVDASQNTTINITSTSGHPQDHAHIVRRAAEEVSRRHVRNMRTAMA